MFFAKITAIITLAGEMYSILFSVMPDGKTFSKEKCVPTSFQKREIE